MGWPGGTDVMDVVTKGVMAVLNQILTRVSDEGADASDVLIYEREAMLKPFIQRLAEELRERGWDSEEEAEHFLIFPQEMLGYDDKAFESWLRFRVHETSREGTPEEIMAAAKRLQDHVDKTKEGKA